MVSQDAGAVNNVALIMFCMANHTVLRRSEGRLQAALQGRAARRAAEAAGMSGILPCWSRVTYGEQLQG
jgi:hypothetical protein